MRFRRQAGFTLTELMVITVMIGVLAMIIAPSIRRWKDKAMVAATKADLRNAMMAIESYLSTYDAYPATLADLGQVGYVKSENVLYCRFERVQGSALEAPYVAMDAMHRGSNTLVTAQYPRWGTRMQESKVQGSACGTSSSVGAGNSGGAGGMQGG